MPYDHPVMKLNVLHISSVVSTLSESNAESLPVREVGLTERRVLVFLAPASLSVYSPLLLSIAQSTKHPGYIYFETA